MTAMFRKPRTRTLLLFVGFAALLVVAPIPLRAATFPYIVEDIGAPPGESHAIPFGINATGDVVGWSGFYRAFVFTDGAGMVELFGPQGRPSATARGINDAGVI